QIQSRSVHNFQCATEKDRRILSRFLRIEVHNSRPVDAAERSWDSRGWTDGVRLQDGYQIVSGPQSRKRPNVGARCQRIQRNGFRASIRTQDSRSGWVAFKVFALLNGTIRTSVGGVGFVDEIVESEASCLGVCSVRIGLFTTAIGEVKRESGTVVESHTEWVGVEPVS